MKTIAFITGFALMALLLPVLAFGAPWLVCDPNPGAIGVILEVNGIEFPEFPTETDGSLRQDLAGYDFGDYTVRAKANFGVWGWSEYSAPFDFLKPEIRNPLNLRVSSE